MIPSLTTTSTFIKQIVGKSLSALTPLQRKVFVIFSCTIALLTIGYAIGRRFKARSQCPLMSPTFQQLIKKENLFSFKISKEAFSDQTSASQVENKPVHVEDMAQGERPFSPDFQPQVSEITTPLADQSADKEAKKSQSKELISHSLLSSEVTDPSPHPLPTQSEVKGYEASHDHSSTNSLVTHSDLNTANREGFANNDVSISEQILHSSSQEEGAHSIASHANDLATPSAFEAMVDASLVKELSELNIIPKEKSPRTEASDAELVEVDFKECSSPASEAQLIEELPSIEPPVPETIEKPLPLLKDRSDLEATAGLFINAKLYKSKCDVISKFLDEIYQTKDVECEEERTNCILYLADYLIKNHKVNEAAINSLISCLKAYAKAATPEIQESLSTLSDPLAKRQQALEILSSYKTLLFKKGDPWQELSNQEAFNLLENIDNHPLNFDLLIKCMLICTFNEGQLDRLTVNHLLSKGLQIIRKETTSIEYGSAGNAPYIFEKLYQKYLNVYSDALKVKYRSQNGSLVSHEIFKKEENQFIISTKLADGHYTNTLVDMAGDGFKMCDNCAAHLRYDELNAIPPPPQSLYTLYMPQTLYQSVKNRVQLEKLCIPRWEANNCYLSAGWLTFAFLFYFYKQAHDIEQEALQKELIA